MSDPFTSPRSGGQFTTIGVLFVALLFMGIAVVENLKGLPWSPFYLVYIGLATVLPLLWRTAPFGPLRAVKWWLWALAVVIPFVMQAFTGFFLLRLWPSLMTAMGVDATAVGTAYYDYNAMFAAMLTTAAAKWGVPVQAMMLVYVGLIVVWAGYGEEVFYRGYVHTSLRARIGVGGATLVSAFLFAIRHYAQMVILWPDYPWAAATGWVIVGFVLGIVMSLLYEKSRSLYPPVVAHYLFNIIPFVAILSGS